ncbi:MAG: ABC transporter permease, partial [Chloroflexi bacterium]
ALLGQTVLQNLFPNRQSPVSQSVQIRNVPFTVIGVLASKGTGVGGNQDDVVLIPFPDRPGAPVWRHHGQPDRSCFRWRARVR